jgi:hypothetical protein
MESLAESEAKILAAMTADDRAVRAAYLNRYSADIREFASAMAAAEAGTIVSQAVATGSIAVPLGRQGPLARPASC